MTCAGDPRDGRGCPGSSTRFVVSPAAVQVESPDGGDCTAQQLGWVLIAHCAAHESPVLDFVRDHVGPDLWRDAVTAQIEAMPLVVHELGLFDALGPDEPVLTNVPMAG